MNSINAGGQESAHSFFSRERNGIKIDGVNDVISFDEGGAVFLTACGNMAIEGEELHVTVLNIANGIVELSGKINGLYYFDDKPPIKKGLFRKRADGE
jgi:sporulation protein YabP